MCGCSWYKWIPFIPIWEEFQHKLKMPSHPTTKQSSLMHCKVNHSAEFLTTFVTLLENKGTNEDYYCHRFDEMHALTPPQKGSLVPSRE